MESIGSHERMFYSRDMVKLINRYNYLFQVFTEKFGAKLKAKFNIDSNDTIIGIQRGLVSGDKQLFWDYLGATHGIIQTLPVIPEGLDPKNAYRCVRLKLKTGKFVTLATNTLPGKTPKDILCLDDYYNSFDNLRRKEFDRILFEITKIESVYFHSMLYKEKLKFIKNMSNEQLYKVLNLN